MALNKTLNRNSLRYPNDVRLVERKIVELQTAIEALVTLVTEVKTDFNAHVHTGVTAGSASSGASDLSITAADVTL